MFSEPLTMKNDVQLNCDCIWRKCGLNTFGVWTFFINNRFVPLILVCLMVIAKL